MHSYKSNAYKRVALLNYLNKAIHKEQNNLKRIFVSPTSKIFFFCFVFN